MRFDALPLTFSLTLFLCVDYALAAPSSSLDEPSSPLHIPILRRAQVQRSAIELGAWAEQQKQHLEGKYGRPSARNTKRSTGYNLLVDQNGDSSYYGSIAIGTPPIQYNVTLDSGSADLLLVGPGCTSQSCNGLQPFNSSASSTYSNVGQPFSITYGSGGASGVLAKDVVQMAGFEVNQQTFAVCDKISDGLVTAPVSGLMGLGWQSLSSSGAMPFWQSLYGGNAWDQPVMTIYLTRFQNESNAQPAEPGGVFTMGSMNTSLYTGDIDFQTVQTIQPSGPLTYWTLPLTKLTVGSSSITLPSGSSSYAAIDSGTTLIGGPLAQVAAVYALVPGSVAGTGSFDGYYLYPCSTAVNVALSFGGQTWPISPSDFKLSQISSSQCLGAVFAFTGNVNGPPWIIGDTFLKNVYTVFRAKPASVGFAALAADAQSLITQGGVPTPTIGAVGASVTGARSNAALPRCEIPHLAFSFLFVLSTSLSYLLLGGL